MACWQDEAIPVLRALISDLDYSSLTFSDDRLISLLLASAFSIKYEATFTNSYTVVVSAGTISPDPSSDTDFMYLMTLKAACMLDRGNARAAMAANGISARCGPAQITTSGYGQGMLDLLRSGYCKVYEEVLFQHNLGNSENIKAIMSPFVNSNFFPEDYSALSSRLER